MDNQDKKEVKIIPMDGRIGRFVVVDTEGNVVIVGNGCGFKSRVNAQRALNRNEFKLIYDNETKSECADYYKRQNAIRNFWKSKGLID